jgi:ethanolamine transporter EutH
MKSFSTKNIIEGILASILSIPIIEILKYLMAQFNGTQFNSVLQKLPLLALKTSSDGRIVGRIFIVLVLSFILPSFFEYELECKKPNQSGFICGLLVSIIDYFTGGLIVSLIPFLLLFFAVFCVIWIVIYGSVCVIYHYFYKPSDTEFDVFMDKHIRTSMILSVCLSIYSLLYLQ